MYIKNRVQASLSTLKNALSLELGAELLVRQASATPNITDTMYHNEKGVGF
jgi:hypothetical protein